MGYLSSVILLALYTTTRTFKVREDSGKVKQNLDNIVNWPNNLKHKQ